MRMTVAMAVTMFLCACDGSGGASPPEPVNVASACEFATRGTALDGRVVRFRSGLDLGMEFVRVVDPGCPRLMVFFRHAAGSNVDLTLCSAPDSRYGCPVNPDFEVKATFTGVFHASKAGGGHVDVVSMTEVSGENDR